MNHIECYFLETDVSYASALKWANTWGGVGILGLRAQDLQKLHDFRLFIAKQSVGGMIFSTVVKDLMTSRATLSALLRNDLRNMRSELVPRGLFRRNGGLYGELEVTHTRVYGVNDKTQKGEPKEGWRLIFMEGCPLFMESLSKYPESHRFTLGLSLIHI